MTLNDRQSPLPRPQSDSCLPLEPIHPFLRDQLQFASRIGRLSVVAILLFEALEFGPVSLLIGENRHCKIFRDGIVGVLGSIDK